MLRRLRLIAMLMLVLSSISTIAQNGTTGKSFVQAASEERLYQVTIHTVKPEMWREAIEFVKNEVVPIRTKGGQKHMECWTSVFGDVHDMWFITPLENFALMDKPSNILLKALGTQEAVNAHIDKGRRYTNSIRQFVIRVRPDLSYIKPNAGAPKAATVTTVELEYGREEEVWGVIKSEWVPAQKKSDRYGHLRAPVVRGSGNEYLSIVPMENFAELDKPDVMKQVLGEEGLRKALAKFAGNIKLGERRVLLFRPDLSILPTSNTAAK